MSFHNIPPNGFPDLPDMEEVAGLANDVSNLSSSKANQITIAPFFNAEASYDPGDLIYYNGLSYRCVNAHEGEWDADDFASTTVEGELATLKSGLTSVSGKLITVITYYDATNQVYPVATPPAASSQITILGRNFSTGAIYAMWYDSSKSGFILVHVLVGNNPSDRDAVTLQYLA